MDLLERMQARLAPYARHIGIRLTSASPERITAEMEIVEDLNNANGVAHGGALMSFADTLGALGTVANLQPGFVTTTLESKTNFIGAAPVGSTILGEATPIHRGRSTMIFQTRITTKEGKLLALVTQTQMVMAKKG